MLPIASYWRSDERQGDRWVPASPERRRVGQVAERSAAALRQPDGVPPTGYPLNTSLAGPPAPLPPRPPAPPALPHPPLPPAPISLVLLRPPLPPSPPAPPAPPFPPRPPNPRVPRWNVLFGATFTFGELERKIPNEPPPPSPRPPPLPPAR